MNAEYRHDRLSRWLVPSLLFHLLLIFLFVLFEREKKAPAPAPIVFFDDEAQPQPPPAIPPPLQASTQQTEDEKEETFRINLAKSSTFGAPAEQSEETQLPGDPLSMLRQRDEDLEQDKQQADEKMSEEMPEPLAQAPEIMSAAEITSGSETTPGPEKPEKKEPPKRRVKNFWGQGAQTKAPVPKNMTLVTLAEGFLDYVKETRTAPVDINTRDLHLEPTMQKIGYALQNSFHLNNQPIALNQDVQKNIALHLELDATGELLNCYLTPSTESASLDRNLMRIAEKASPFPPIPPHVMRNKKTFCVKIPIEVDAKSGTHQYYFVFRG